MKKLNETVVPLELIVGIKDELCFITYEDKKGMNSKTSWTNWSKNADNPLRVKNKFSKGFKLSGVNSRWSRQANNQSNLLVYHPLAKKSLEISLDDFVHLASQCAIINGEFDIDLIISKDRKLLTLSDYEKCIAEKAKEAQKAKKFKDDLKADRVSYKNAVKGKLYTNGSNGGQLVYLGTAKHEEVIKHCYLDWWLSEGVESVDKLDLFRRKEYSYWSSERKEVPSYSFKAIKSKTPLSKHEKEVNVFDGMSQIEWEHILIVYRNAGYSEIDWKDGGLK